MANSDDELSEFARAILEYHEIENYYHRIGRPNPHRDADSERRRDEFVRAILEGQALERYLRMRPSDLHHDVESSRGCFGSAEELPSGSGYETAQIDEAHWDPAKHGRGGFVQNRGWFSPTGGSGGGAPPHILTVSNKSTQHRGAFGRAAPRANQTLPRDPVYLAQNKDKKEARRKEQERIDRESQKDSEERARILNRLGGVNEPPPRTPGTLLGKRTWTDKRGKKLDGTLENISKDGKSVTFRLSNGTTTEPILIDRLDLYDQALIKGAQALPKNVTFKTDGLSDQHKKEWTDAVIRDFGRLNDLPSGAKLLNDIANNRNNGITIQSRSDDDKGNRVNYTPSKGGSNDVIVSYSPTDRKGWKVDGGMGTSDRPPFLALGKELSTGAAAAKAEFNPNIMDEERESGKFENKLRDEFNTTLNDPKDRLRHPDLPK